MGESLTLRPTKQPCRGWHLLPSLLSHSPRVEADMAGRAYAAYGGVYIVASLAWLWTVEGARPDRWDVLGATLCILGAGVILFGPRGIVAD